MEKPYFVGVTGGSGSGKSYFMHKLVDSLDPALVTVVPQDNYYLPRQQQPKDRKGIENFDLPESFDVSQFVKDLQDLRSGNTVKKLEYSYNNPDFKPKELIFTPAPVIIVEGIFVFHFPEVLEMLDLRLFVDAKDHIKIKRRILRDRVERGYDLQDVLYRYEQHVMPSYDRYIRAHKREADLIICNDRHFDRALEVITCFLQNKSQHAG